MREVWKPVQGYESLYSVSNLGRVVGKKYNRLLKTKETPQGYLQVVLSKYGKPKCFRVHRLVATAFCEKAEGKDVVNHIDNNPSNNRADNLEWVTQKENVRHAASVGVRTIHKVVRTDGETEVHYSTLHEAASGEFDINKIRACCRGEIESYKGYKWRYE